MQETDNDIMPASMDDASCSSPHRLAPRNPLRRREETVRHAVSAAAALRTLRVGHMFGGVLV